MALLQQAVFLLKLFLRLKSWRFAYCVLPIACLVSNTYLYQVIEGPFSQFSQAYLGVTSYGADDFVKDSKVVANTNGGYQGQVQAMQDIVASRRGGSPAAWLTDCNSDDDCDAKYFRALHSTLGGEVWSYVEFFKSEYLKPYVSCLLAENVELSCSYVVHLVKQSIAKNASADAVFSDVKFLSLVSQQARNIFSQPEKSPQVVSDPLPVQENSICNKNQGQLYQMIFPIVIMVQLILVSSGFAFYVTFGNLSCISRLKRDGFLQQMFQNGLSVSAYWGVIWFITVLEMLVFGAIAAMAFHFQCPGYYPGGSILLAFLIVFLFGIFISSLGYLFTSLIKSYFIILLLMVLINVALNVLIIVGRVQLNIPTASHVARDALLIFPFGHVAEFLVEILVLKSALTGYPLAILVLCVLVPILLILLSFYVDFLFQNGNGFCLPPSFLFQPQFWSVACNNSAEMAAVAEETSRPNIEPVEEGLQSLIHVRSVDKVYQKRDYPCSSLNITVALNKISCKH